MSASETYDKILQTAGRLFVQQGYTATSMRQVAEQAGIGKATIYHHFPDKQAIALALLKMSADRMGQVLERIREEQEPRQRIQAAARESVNFLFESADIMQVARRELAGGREQMQIGFMHFFQEYTTLLADAIQRGVQQGIFRPVDPGEAARVLLTMIQGAFAMSYLGARRGGSPEQTSAAMLDIFFQGIDHR